MAIGKNFQRMLRAALGNFVSRRFWNEPDKSDLEERRKSLNDGWRSPWPIPNNIIGPEGQPSSDNATEVPGSLKKISKRSIKGRACEKLTVINRGENSPVLGVHKLGDEKRWSAMGNSDTKAKEESGSHEHLEVHADSLQNNAYDPEK
jgi:hypothetical protein